jgi:hypothetical protein
MDDTDPDKLDAVRERLEALREQRLAERIEAGEIISVPLFIVAGSATEAARQAEQAKADKLSELRAAGEIREIMFAVTMAVTGVLRPGEAADPASVPSAPSFSSREDAAIRPALPLPVTAAAPEEVVEDEVRAEPKPVIESYIFTTIHQATDTDPGAILEGWWSIDGKVLTLTGADGKHITSRAITAGEDPKALARMLLREKRTPEEFQRRLDYPKLGLA